MDTCRAYALCKLAMEPIHFFLLCCCRMIGYIVQPLFIVGRDCLPARRLESIRIVQLPYNCSIRSTLITASSMLDRFFVLFCCSITTICIPSENIQFWGVNDLLQLTVHRNIIKVAITFLAKCTAAIWLLIFTCAAADNSTIHFELSSFEMTHVTNYSCIIMIYWMLRENSKKKHKPQTQGLR